MSHATATREQWLKQRLELLAAEKEHTRRSDELAKQRQALPWVRVAKDYRFDTDAGPASLADLFRGRSQLLVYHFMFGPGWGEGCKSCSFVADHLAVALVPLYFALEVGDLAAQRAQLELALQGAGEPSGAAQSGDERLLISGGESDGGLSPDSFVLDLRSAPGSVREGRDAAAAATLTLTEEDLLTLSKDPGQARDLFQRGRLRIDGDIRTGQRLGILKGLV